MKRILLILYCLLLVAYGFCAVPSTEGKEFWVTFMNNIDEEIENLDLSLIVSSKYNATVTVANPQTMWEQSFVVTAGFPTIFSIPQEQAYAINDETIEKKGLKVTSTAIISLYSSNFASYTYDATNILPVTALGDNYIIQTYDNAILEGWWGSKKSPMEFAIVASQDNTIVTINPHARTLKGHIKNIPFQVSLNQGEVYQVKSVDENADLSGTQIESNKPIAVFAGHRCVFVPQKNAACDHIVEQQQPTRMWGKQFVVTKAKVQRSSIAKVTASEDNTILFHNGAPIATLNAFDTYEFKIVENSSFIETTKPSACYVYFEGAIGNNNIGDPSSVHISPLEQRIKELTFATFETDVSRSHYVNIITTSAGAATMTLDGLSISHQFSVVSGNPQLRYAQINLNNGVHNLKTMADGFTGYVYGVGWCESYAYSIGSATIDLQSSILINGESNNEFESKCYRNSFIFSPQANIEYNSITWDFGDGVFSNQSIVSHNFTTSGDYTIRMILNTDQRMDTVVTILHLVDIINDTIYASICEGDTYIMDGYTYSSEGEYTISYTSENGCDSIITLYIIHNPQYLNTKQVTLVNGTSYRWRGKWYQEAGIYRDTLVAQNGCDSIMELILLSSDPLDIMYDTICYQPTYTFHEHDYDIPIITNIDEEYVGYVLEYRDINNCKAYKMNLSISTKPSGDYELYDTIQVGNTYNFFGDKLTKSGTYFKTYNSGVGCEQNYTLHLEVLPFPIYVTEETLCNSENIIWRESTYSKAGIYNDTLFSPAGIKAVYRLILTDGRSYETIDMSITGSYTLNGYTYTESGTYVQKLTNIDGCDSIVTIHLGINEPCSITMEESVSLCSGTSFIWNDQLINTANDYTFHTTSCNGCDSIVILHVKNASTLSTNIEVNICEGDYYKYNGEKLTEAKTYTYHYPSRDGCDSVVNITIGHIPTFHTSFTETIIEGQNYDWEGDVYYKEGYYTKGFAAKSNNCDSIVTLHLIVEHCSVSREENKSICAGEYYDFYGNKITIPNTYTHIVTDEDCDTVVTLNLSISLVLTGDTAATFCNDHPFKWHGVDYSTAGDYTHTYTSQVTGCDSIVTLHLTQLETTDSVETVTICEGETHTWHGNTYTSTTDVTETITNSVGCDSVCTLHLKVNPKLTGDTTATFCNGTPFIWHGTSYPTGGDYPYTYTSKVTGCDSIVTLHLTQLEPTDSIENVTLCAGGTHTWHGQTFTSSTTITETIPNAAGCDSVCTLNLTILPALMGDTSATFCNGKSFTWHGTQYSIAGHYPYTYTSKVAPYCDSIVTLHLTQLEPTDSVENVTLCYGESHVWHGQTFTTSTTITETIPNSAGCDSVCTLQLTVLPTLTGDTSATFCKGHPFQWHGVEYSNTGDYQRTYTSRVTGCDSIVTLHLTQLEPTDSIEIVTICAGASHIWHGQTFTSSITTTETITNAAGCDSVCTLQLTVLPALTGDTSATFCKGHPFQWHGTPYTNGGDYPYTYTSKATGCDSIVTLHLSQLEPSDSVEYATICEGESYTWHDHAYTSTTDITETIPNAAGCDSVCTLHLKVNPKLSGDTTASVCDGGTFTWWSNTYSEKGNYTRTFQSQVTGCDSIVTLHLNILPPLSTTLNESITEGATYIWNEQTYAEKGTYTQSFTTDEGCDSIVTLNLTVNPLIYDILSHTHCADDPFIEFDVTASDGLFHQLQFVFTPKATAQHFRDTIVDYSASQILIPNSARAGIYDVAVSPLFNSQVLDTRNIQFTLLYPSSVLDQHWDDFIGVLTHNYNGGYDFVRFQWYKNGQPMVGENHSYTYQPLEMGAAYSAMLEEQDGTKLMTCEIIATPQTEISIYPTLLQPNQIIRLHSSEDVTIWLYDSLGKLLYTNSFERGDSQFAAPQDHGIYIVKIQQTGEQGKSETKKLIVR